MNGPTHPGSTGRRRAIYVAVAVVAAVVGGALVGGPSAGAIPVDPPTCAPGPPSIVGTSSSTLVVERVPCPGNPSGITYRLRVTPVGATTPVLTVDLPNDQVRRELPGVPELPSLEAGTPYRVTAASRNYAGLGPGSASSPIAVPPFATVDAFATGQFLDLLGRAPTTTERSDWATAIQAGTLPVDQIAFLLAAPYWQEQSPIIRLYRAYFLRLPDTAGLNYWVGKRRSSPPKTLDWISSNFAGSSEFAARYGSLTNQQFVEHVYQNVLGRTGDPTGISYYVNQLNNNGRSRGWVMLQFSESNEHKTDQADMVRIVNAFTGLVRRVPIAAEVSAWGGAATPAMVRGLMAMSEYEDRYALEAPPAPIPSYPSLFTRFDQPYGWVAGDGGGSVRLPDGRELWAFGDSAPGYLTSNWNGSDGSIRVANSGRNRQQGWINNSLVITRPGTTTFETKLGAGTTPSSPKSFFPPTSGGNFQYPAAMVVEPYFDVSMVRVFLSEVFSSPVAGSCSVSGRRTIASLGTSSLASYGTTEPIPRPEWITASGKTGCVDFGNAVLSDGGYTYVYGSWQEQNNSFNQRMFVARVPVGKITEFGQWRYFAGIASGAPVWSDDPTDVEPVMDQVSNSIVKTPQGYVTATLRHWDAQAGPDVQRRIDLHRAPTPFGPWITLAATTIGPGTDFGYLSPSLPHPIAPVWTKLIPDDPGLGHTKGASVLTNNGLVGEYKSYLPIIHTAISDPATPSNPQRVLLSWSNDYSTATTTKNSDGEVVPIIGPNGQPTTVDRSLKYGYLLRFDWVDLSGL